MANFLRMMIGLALLPACWGFVRAFADSLVAAAGSGISYESVSFLGGIAAFALCLLALSHPVRTYVLGKDFTLPMGGLLFGANPSRVKVSLEGGSVRVTKTSSLLALAPY